MKPQLQKTEDGYIVIRGDRPQFVVERCPADMNDTHRNVLALMPVREVREFTGLDSIVMDLIRNIEANHRKDKTPPEGGSAA